jgi:UDP-2-acetamido-2-deoxy-ribo-hexuluronate aminotransferase
VLGKTYNDAIDRIGLGRIVQRPDRTSVFSQYTVMIVDRADAQSNLQSVGIPTAVHYPTPLNRQEPYREYCCGDCTPVADFVAERVMSLPMSPDLDPLVVRQVVDALQQFSR